MRDVLLDEDLGASKYRTRVCQPEIIERATVSPPFCGRVASSGLIHPKQPRMSATMLPYFASKRVILKPVLAV